MASKAESQEPSREVRGYRGMLAVGTLVLAASTPFLTGCQSNANGSGYSSSSPRAANGDVSQRVTDVHIHCNSKKGPHAVKINGIAGQAWAANVYYSDYAVGFSESADGKFFAQRGAISPGSEVSGYGSVRTGGGTIDTYNANLGASRGDVNQIIVYCRAEDNTRANSHPRYAPFSVEVHDTPSTVEVPQTATPIS